MLLEVQKYLKTHTLEDLKDEFNINSKVYNDRVVLKYRIDSKPKFSQIVKECRGLILSLPGYEVMARGFDRFFNYGEGTDLEKFDWNNCNITNKLDGSCLKVYYDGDKWCVSTNGTAFAEGETPMGKSFHDLFIEAIGMSLYEGFKHCANGYTYIFELTSPENRIVTRYHKTKATLLAIRYNFNGNFIDNISCINTIKYFNFNCDLVDSYTLNHGDIIDFVESRDQMDEGIVCHDFVNDIRIKVKNSSYVCLHALKSNGILSERRIIDLLFKRDEMDEYILHFPEDKDVMLPYKNAYISMIDDINNSYKKYKNIENQKEFALEIKHSPVVSILFAMRKGYSIGDVMDKISTDAKSRIIFKYILKDGENN